MWRVYKDSGRPWPKVCDDDVTDYMVMEAVALKARKEDRDAEKEAERKQWKEETKAKLKPFT